MQCISYNNFMYGLSAHNLTFIIFNNYLTVTDYSWNYTIIARSFMTQDLVENENFTFYFPLTTSLLITILISFILW